MPRFAGAIFDMDGLMLDTERPSMQAWKQAAMERGFSISDAVFFRTMGVAESVCRQVYADEFGDTKLGVDFPYEEIRERVRIILDNEFEKNGIGLRPGLIPLLDRLAAMNMPLAVATSTHKKRALWKLEKTGLTERFSAFAFGDEVDRGKPAPDIFLLAAQRLGNITADCIGFEDSPAGLLGLHSAGIRSVFVKDLIEPPPEVLSTVWWCCTDLAAAVELIE
ncbi:MAG: HAD family phosphatase [Treponema sp.]|nr:HAD family phosphatase [Treponema sp.]